MWSYIFINYYLGGLYFGVIDSAQNYPHLKFISIKNIMQSYFIVTHVRGIGKEGLMGSDKPPFQTRTF